MASVRIVEEYCKGCGLCVRFCPKGALQMSSRRNAAGVNVVEIVPGVDCTGCRSCVMMCPDAAIVLSVEVPVEK